MSSESSGTTSAAQLFVLPITGVQQGKLGSMTAQIERLSELCSLSAWVGVFVLDGSAMIIALIRPWLSHLWILWNPHPFAVVVPCCGFVKKAASPTLQTMRTQKRTVARLVERVAGHGHRMQPDPVDFRLGKEGSMLLFLQPTVHKLTFAMSCVFDME